MRSINLPLFNLSLFLILISGPIASADVTIDFQSLEHEDASFELLGDPSYTESGFVINGASLGTVGTEEERYSGSTALVASAQDSLLSLSRVGGGAFGIDSITLSEFDGGAAIVTFTGLLVGGGTTSQSFSTDGVLAPETFTFDSSFDQVVDVFWIQGSPNHQFDNIQVVAVPEPTSAFLIAALGLVGITARRRR